MLGFITPETISQHLQMCRGTYSVPRTEYKAILRIVHWQEPWNASRFLHRSHRICFNDSEEYSANGHHPQAAGDRESPHLRSLCLSAEFIQGLAVRSMKHKQVSARYLRDYSLSSSRLDGAEGTAANSHTACKETSTQAFQCSVVRTTGGVPQFGILSGLLLLATSHRKSWGTPAEGMEQVQPPGLSRTPIATGSQGPDCCSTKCPCFLRLLVVRELCA